MTRLTAWWARYRDRRLMKRAYKDIFTVPYSLAIMPPSKAKTEAKRKYILDTKKRWEKRLGREIELPHAWEREPMNVRF